MVARGSLADFGGNARAPHHATHAAERARVQLANQKPVRIDGARQLQATIKGRDKPKPSVIVRIADQNHNLVSPLFGNFKRIADQANADRIAAAASDRGAAVGAAFSDGFAQTVQDSDPLSTLAKQSLELLSQIEKVSAPKVGSVSGGLDSAIGALQQVISLQDELDRGAQASTGLFSRTFDSLRGTTPAVSSPEERMLRELIQLKLLFAKQSLPKVEQLLDDLKTLLAGGVPARLS